MNENQAQNTAYELVSCGDHRVLNCHNAEGLRIKGVDSLFNFGYRRRTVSPRVMLFGLARFRLSLYDFMVDLFFSSRLRISSSFSELLGDDGESGR